jgi:site-specific recombinase XerD
MQGALETMAGILSSAHSNVRSLYWPALRYQHTQALRAALAAQYAPATTNKLLAALRGVLKECWRLGLMDAETYHRAADLKTVKASAHPRGRALAVGELRALFDACMGDAGSAGVRDAAVFALLYGAGLRRSEVVKLETTDYNPEDGSVTVRAGKGRKDRNAYLSVSCAQLIEAWLQARGDDPGPLVCPINKAGRLSIRAMTAQAVFNLVRKRCHQAGIPVASPHDLRRTFVSDLLDSGADISVVQQLAGHSSISTTSRYDRRGEGAKRTAAGLLRVPPVGDRGTIVGGIRESR